MNNDSAGIERRSGQRFQLYVPLTMDVNGRSVPGYAQDISARGILLVAEVCVSQSTVVELTFTMPAEITLGESMPVRARGRVLRVEPSQAGTSYAMAVLIDSYQYLPSPEEESQAELARVLSERAPHNRAITLPQ